MASPPTSTRQWVLASQPTDAPVLSGPGQTFRLETKPLHPLKENQALVRTVYLSNDPAQRGWIAKDTKRLYRPPVMVNDVMAAGGIVEVLQSTSDALKPGALLYSSAGWTEFAVIDAAGAVPLPDLPGGLAITHHLGAVGGTGFTAFYGFNVIAEAKADDVVVVSGAAGATGSMVVQIAKRMVGCKRVIGIAGGEKKCRWVEEYLGADVCVDYKSPSFKDDLAQATGGDDPNVDVYFDNVGGEILDLMLMRMAKFGRVAACGAISTYNTSPERAEGLKNWMVVVMMRLQLRGFIVTDYLAPERRREMQQYLLKGVEEGKLKIGEENQHVVPAKFEDVPEVWTKLFGGGNTGKLITKVEA